ncbi:helix-turn-helix domain-containing protein [Streptomyces sp. NPDC046182]|uniref:helix-turn-helix domain-containing protein n=1 Tax=Streptomyces sp. NPDC046182 TaxID=3154601 RepID=UPI0033DAF9BD
MGGPYDGRPAAPERGGDGLSEQQRAALQMPASGMKDEKIARNLGVSLRTVSRMLSQLMQESVRRADSRPGCARCAWAGSTDGHGRTPTRAAARHTAE